jgi:hypothetical protein
MYLVIGFCIPVGLLTIFSPELSDRFISGASLWLAAIPHDLYLMFGGCFAVYVGARSYDKRKK